MAEERRITIPGILERVPEVCSFVAAAAEAVGLDDRGVYHCEMAADEWCTNIIEHGYAGRVSSHIQVTLQLRPAELTVTFADDGPSFDPTTLPEPDPSQPLEDRQPGGLGWFFIRKIMDDVRYEFKQGHNVLTMVKRGVPRETPDMEHEPESPFPAHTLSSGVRVVRPAGRIDSVNGRDFEIALLKQVDAGFMYLVVDMSGVTYMSSTGLKTLLTVMRRLGEHGGKIALAAMGDRVREVFSLSGFDTLFTLTAHVDEAASAVKS